MAFQQGAFQDPGFQITTQPVGDAGAATFAINVEAGARVTYGWKTDVLTSLAGLEQRAATRNRPRQRYEFSTLLSDAQHRRVLSVLAGNAAAAPLFLLGIAFEDLTVVSSTAGSITVSSLVLCDWAVPGQRMIVVAPWGEIGEAVVQSTIGSTIAVNADLTAVAVEGARAMPAMGVFLDPDQALGRHRCNLGRWDLVATAERSQYGNFSPVGNGVLLTVYDAMPVWTFGIGSRFAGQPLYSGAELVDLGGRISALPAFDQAAWGRAIRLEGKNQIEWQLLKRFLDTIQGRRRKFLLPSGRPDLTPIGDASTGTLTVEGPPMPDAPDYANHWFPSLAHRRLRLVRTDGAFAFRKVLAVAAAVGSQDLLLDAPYAGALARVEFLEQVRLESDEVAVTWQGHVFTVELGARVVQQ